ncbi:hypothetical protein KY290_006470 [Solanum tuberosum]|uniref:NET domain-containing protein n=1 Tax=Solanum tuberosum TaxID=4113 RepID=A0ABQ7WJ11_SOLTU|nr:hypothetical protein KY285_004620 [Solanum tuberosum]KAH0780043.1 hypothetical protein KY290_006470 [Solanum tuberosum]
MDSEERRRFSGKVYTRRTLKKDASVAADVTRVSETLNGEQPVKVVAKTTNLTHSTSGDVPEGGVELREVDNCSGEEMVTIRFNESKSITESRNVRSRLEGELNDIRRMVRKIEVKEISLNKRRLVLIPGRPKISCRYPDVTRHMINRPPSPNYHLVVCGTIEREKRIPKVNQHDNPPVCGIVEREKRIRKVNQYYSSSDYLLGKDKLPSEIYKTSQKNKNETKNKGFALNRNREDLPTCRNARHPIPFVDALRQGRILERGKSITGAADPREMTIEEIEKVNRGLENLPEEELSAVAEMIKKRGVPYKQNNGELELDINNIDAETMWELNRFVTNYYNKRKSKARSSGSKVAAALKEAGTSGEMRSSTHVEGGSEANSDSGSSSTDNFCFFSDLTPIIWDNFHFFSDHLLLPDADHLRQLQFFLRSSSPFRRWVSKLGFLFLQVTFGMDSEERRFSGKVYSRRNRKTLKKDISPATAAGVTAPETKVSETLDAEQPAKVTFPMNSEERRFSGKVYSRRNRKTSAAGVATLETKVSETLHAEQPAKVIPQADFLITNSTSGDVPEGGVELREGSQPNRSLILRAEYRVRVRLNKSRSLVEIREARRVLEGELDDVRGMVKKIEAKEQLQHTSRKHRGLVLKSSRPISSYRYPRFTVDDVLKNRCPNFVRPIDLPNPFHAPSLAAIASYGIVEREKRTRKPNRNARHPIPFVDALRQGRILERGKKITGAADPRKKKPSNKRDMMTEEGEMLSSTHVEGGREVDNSSSSDSGSSSI